MAPSFRIITFGCKVNQCDSQILRETLASWGLTEAESETADLLIINSCTVTGSADAKFKKALRKARRENAGSLIALTGCFASRMLPTAQPPEADLVFQFNNPAALLERLQRHGIVHASQSSGALPQSYFAEHTRAFLKIQDGCDCFCSYCIVPFVRPSFWSLEPEAAIAAIHRLSAQGYKEVVLTGIHLGFYGRRNAPQSALAGAVHSRPSYSLFSLLSQIDQTCAIERVRLSSIEINEVTDEIIHLIACSSRICHHFHLPLQSGDNDILRRMNRRYTADFFLQRLDEIRKTIPGIGITTDIIVGFPGETEGQFRRTLNVVQNIEFAKIHVFRYSRRPGAAAGGFDAPVPPNEIARRSRELIQTGNQAAARFKQRIIGKTLPVLVETFDRDTRTCQGLTASYIRVHIAGLSAECVNTIVPAHITGVDENASFARATPEAK